MRTKLSFTNRGLSLIEILITVSIFSVLGLLIARMSSTFVELYARSRDQADLLRLQRLTTKSIAEGDDLYFDGLKSAPEIIEANDSEISFVPMYRDTSEPSGYYLTNGLFNNVSLGPPVKNNRFNGGLRIQFNELSQKYELRYYLSKLPRAGSSPPEVFIKYDANTLEPMLSELKANLNIFSEVEWAEYVKRYHSVPVKLRWEAPNDKSRLVPSTYIVFTGGNYPLEIDGTENQVPSVSQIKSKMQRNKGQLFPDPFNRPEDTILLYYHPETEFAVIRNQQHLIARLFVKGAYDDQINRFDFTTEIVNNYDQIFDRSLCLYYDRKLTVIPDQKELLNINLEASRPQFLIGKDLPLESELSPTKFSYYNSRDTTSPILLTSRNGRLQVPPENLYNISLVRFDLLNIIGQNLENFSFDEILKRNYSQIIPLQNLSFTHSFHTRTTIQDNLNLGFSVNNCFQSRPLDTKCKLISKNFPSGDKIRISQSLYISNIVIDTTINPKISGWMSLFFFNPSNRKTYQVKIDFDEFLVHIMLKESYDREDLKYDESGSQSNVVVFPLDNSQFINFTNLQSNGFLDEGFNYSNSAVYADHLGNPDAVELYIEMQETSNIEGFSLSWSPK